MKKLILITFAVLVFLIAAAAVSAQVGLYPIGGGDTPSYPPYYNPGYPYPQQPDPVQPPFVCPQPYYDPSTGRWVQPICLNDPTNPQPVNPQPYYPPYNPQPYYPPYDPQPYYPPYDPNPNVKVSRRSCWDGTVDLTWEIRNTTAESWSKANIDIKCISGSYLLTNPRQTLWDLPYSVDRNSTLTFTVNVTQESYYDSMTFAIVAGSKTLYTFTVNP